MTETIAETEATDDDAEADADTNDQQRILKTLWQPHIGQRVIMNHNARFKVVSAGRRWGKSTFAAHLALEHALEEPNSTVWWVSPSYQQSNDYGFDKIKPLLSPAILADSPKLTKPRKIELTNGSTLSFRSADREDSLRGGGVDLLIMDESASIPERAWIDELRPALTDTLGDMVAVGTPKGRNWFYRWYQRGQSTDHPDTASWQAPSYQNPHVLDSEIDDAKQDMPERVFEQEHLARFVDDTGGVFESVRENVEDYEIPTDPDADDTEAFAIGVDFARFEDWTVIIALNADGRVVAFRRLKEMTWSRIQALIERLASNYPGKVALDASRDNKIVQDLAQEGVTVDPVSFTASKKRTLIENLITRLETGEITLPASANQLINELEVFEYDMSESGQVSYSAPSGFHDDCVDSLALAADALSSAERRTSKSNHDRGIRTF